MHLAPNSRIQIWIITVLLLGTTMCRTSAPAGSTSAQETSSEVTPETGANETDSKERELESAGDGERGVEVVEKPGIYVFHYPETLQLEDPYENYLSKRRVFDDRLGAEIRALLAEEAGYTPEYKARCLPVYDYGIVLVSEDNRQTYLFSFRCNTMHYKEKKLWKDFTPIRTRLYTLLQYQVNDNTSALIDSREY